MKSKQTVLTCRTISLLLAAAVWLNAAGCRSGQSQPLTVPDAVLSLNHFIGTPLSGPMASTMPSTRPSDVLLVRARILALEHVPDNALDPLPARARLIVVTNSGIPVRSVAKLSAAARFGLEAQAVTFKRMLGQPKAVGRLTALGAPVGALPVGVTAVFEASEPQGDLARGVAVEVFRPHELLGDSTLRMALTISDYLPAPPSRSGQLEESEGRIAEPASSQVFRHETVVLDDIAFQKTLRAAFLVPFRFSDSAAQAIVFLIDVSPVSQDQADLDAMKRCWLDLRQATQQAADRPRVADIGTDAESGLQSAMQALADRRTRRRAMVFLASQSDARLCGDIALVCDDGALGTLADRISKSTGSSQSVQSFGWMLDLTSLRLLNEMNANGKLPPELASVLMRHCGEAGRHESSLEEVLKGLSSRKDFNNRLIAENLIFLEDSSPASRVRAFDWLRAKDHAPAGYDPLASEKERRDALDRALGTQEGQP